MSVPNQPPRRPAKPSGAAPARREPTLEEKKIRSLIAKNKRLNMKLSKVKDVAVHMKNISNRTNQVSSRQTENWSRQINNIINGSE